MIRAHHFLAGGLLLIPLHVGQASHLQAEVNHLALHSHVAETHLVATPEEREVCPELVVSLTTMGDPLIRRPEAYALSSPGPAGALGMTLSPLRFCKGERQVSLLDLDMALETSGGTSGTALQVGLVRVTFSF